MNALEHLKLSEGLRLKAYQDTEGVWTIGYGKNLQELEISIELAEEWLRESYSQAQREAAALLASMDLSLSHTREEVITELVYNMGVPRLRTFVRMFAALKAKDYPLAAQELLASRYANQVGERAERLAEVLRTGDWDQMPVRTSPS